MVSSVTVFARRGAGVIRMTECAIARGVFRDYAALEFSPKFDQREGLPMTIAINGMARLSSSRQTAEDSERRKPTLLS
jgi:hypothetical protein